MDQVGQLQLYDIYPTWHIPFWQTSWFYYTIIFCSILVVAALIIGGIRRYKGRKRLQEPWQVALAKLYALQQQQYTSKHASKQCYFAITSILKQYLHTQHNIPAIGKTDDELIRFLQKDKRLEHPVVNQLATICNGGLYIKFANQDAMQQQIREHIELSMHIVQNTKQKSQPTPQS